MSDSVLSRPITRAASRQNYAAQPVTTIRYKFEKPRGHLGTHKLSKDAKPTIQFEEDLLTDLSVPAFAAFPVTETSIGTPARVKSLNLSSNTPLAEIRQRAATVREALETSVLKLQVVLCDLHTRALALAEEAALAYEPAGFDIMQVIRQIANNMVITK